MTSKIYKKIYQPFAEESNPEIQILMDLCQNLSYNLVEYVKPGTIIMIHITLHNLFSAIIATALLSFLKKQFMSV